MQIALPVLAIVALLLGAIAPGLAQTLTVFGDALSDSGLQPTGGGIARWTQSTLQTDEVYPQQPYSNGRFSNGPVWVEQASESLGISYVNWAAGGATSGAGLGLIGPLPAGFAGYPKNLTILAPNLHQQVDQFLGTVNGTANSSDIYVIFIGNNDYLAIERTYKNISADDVVENIKTVMDQLYTLGAQRFILVTIPPVRALPYSFGKNPLLVRAWSAHNDVLRAMGSDFNSTHPRSTVSFFDFGGLALQVFANATAYGFPLGSLPCYPSIESVLEQSSNLVCTDPTQSFLWDSVHPTTTAHALVAKTFVQQFGSLWGKTLSPAPAPSA